MKNKKKATPAQSSHLNTTFNNIYSNENSVVVKQFKSHMAQYRDYIFGVYGGVDDAIDEILKLVNELQLKNKPADFKRVENSFVFNDYVFTVCRADEAVGFNGQPGRFSISRRSARNVFLRLLCWIPLDEPQFVFRCCKEISAVKEELNILELLDRASKCLQCDLSANDLAGQLAYEQAKLNEVGFDELVLLSTLEHLLFLGAKFDLLAALEHAYLLADGFFYAYCGSTEVQYE